MIGGIGIKTNLEKKYPVNEEQINFFKMRQKRHENLVKQACDYLISELKKENNSFLVNIILNNLKNEVEKHDASKWKKPEYFPYIWLTSVYNLNYKWPDKEMENAADEAWKHHYMHNKHHPEYWKSKEYDLNKMDMVNIMHMVCDWAAMSAEFDNSLVDWYLNKASKKYNFSDWQDKLIRKCISILKEEDSPNV